MATTNERRALVNLSVVAGSAAMFAAAWAGIVQTDGERYRDADSPTTAVAAFAPVQAAVIPDMTPAPASSEGQASSQAPRRVVVVRESKAS
ncbi:MAG: hypothetical protein M0R75_15325 [Dehalococcoidia bacterium]|nr:hypothetical protein [Dehalococcoidia bacterium]